MEFNIFVIKQNWELLVEGALMTFVMCGTSLVLGIGVGLVLCIGKMRKRGFFCRACSIFIDVFRTLPELVPIFWIYSAGPLVFKVTLSAEASGILALTIYSGAFLAEIFRGGILAIPKGQYEASAALGIPSFWLWSVVVAPQAARIMTPPFVNFVCDLVKVSSLLATIGIAELAYQATIISGETYRHFEIFTVAGVLYFLIIFPLSTYARRREVAIRKSMR